MSQQLETQDRVVEAVDPLLFAHRDYETLSDEVTHEGTPVALDMSTRTRKSFDNHDDT
jgi:hypothetical protein